MTSATAHREHPETAAEFVGNDARAHWHDQSLWFVRARRDKASQTLPEWEQLRERASQIKLHTMSRLADYLEEFERNATALGAKVYWARTPAEHNEIVLSIIRQHNATRVVKSKSMLTEECHLNPYLERHGVTVTDTDLGEWIVQLRNEPPSHIVMPAIHIKKEEIGELFHERLGTEKGATDPPYLVNAACAGRMPGMTISMHLCRGNFRSTWMAQGGYERVADVLFNQMGVDAYFMEYDTDRAGGFEPLRFLPKGKQVVLGVMTSKTGALEGKDQLKRRIEEAAKFAPLDQLCLSPQCGFASTHHGNKLTEDEQWRKLERVVEVAREVWR